MMSKKLRILAATLISRMPSNKARVIAYRGIFKYKINKNVRIGFGAVIVVRDFHCEDGVTIGRGTSIIGPISVKLEKKVFIGRFNRIECGDVAGDKSKSHMNYALHFEMKEDSLIHENHLFDVYGLISIGKGTWIAGFGSQFLTHGASTQDRNILIGDKCYIGSAVRFAPGTSIADGVIVGMGAVVTKKITESNVVVGGIPAKVIKNRTPDDGYIFEKNW